MNLKQKHWKNKSKKYQEKGRKKRKNANYEMNKSGCADNVTRANCNKDDYCISYVIEDPL